MTSGPEGQGTEMDDEDKDGTDPRFGRRIRFRDVEVDRTSKLRDRPSHVTR